jgi:predicted dehydrogenase
LKVKNPDAIKIGVISAAAINFTSLFDPVQTHQGAEIVAIAARSRAKAEAQVARYKLTSAKVYDTYDELLQDPNVEAVYIPLPNGLHHKWAINALRAGKHVLIEKPIGSNATEAREIQDVANETGKIALEAYHWRLHPAAHRVKEIIESGKYGHVTATSSKMFAPPGAIGSDDIRFNYALGGGASMDLCYVVSGSLYWASDPNDVKGTTFEVLEAKPHLDKRDKRIDEGMDASFVLRSADSARPPVVCTTTCKLVVPRFLGFIPQFWDLTPTTVVELENAKIELTAFIAPYVGHKIIITEKNGKKTTETVYKDGPVWQKKGESWWTTYRYQLEAFVDRVKAAKSQEPYNGPWVDLDESVKLMEIIDGIYKKAGLPVRGAE